MEDGGKLQPELYSEPSTYNIAEYGRQIGKRKKLSANQYATTNNIK